MNVGKKKANEELDLSKVAESFGGYIVEAHGKKKDSKRLKISCKIVKKDFARRFIKRLQELKNLCQLIQGWYHFNKFLKKKHLKHQVKKVDHLLLIKKGDSW